MNRAFPLRRLSVATLTLTSAMGCATSPAYQTPPLPPAPLDRIQHASIEGTLYAAGRPARAQFWQGFAFGVTLGLIGTAIGVATADADPPDVPITPRPRYADTSATYVLAFRQAYDRQVKSDRRGARLGGGLLGTIVETAAILAIINQHR